MPRIEFHEQNPDELFQRIPNTRKTPKTKKEQREQKARLKSVLEPGEEIGVPAQLYPSVLHIDTFERPPFQPPLKIKDIVPYKRMYGPIGDIDLLPAEAQLIAEQREIGK